jgi:hypothetical protein
LLQQNGRPIDSISAHNTSPQDYCCNRKTWESQAYQQQNHDNTLQDFKFSRRSVVMKSRLSGYSAMQSVENQPNFRNNKPLPPSGLENKSEKSYHEALQATCLMPVSSLAYPSNPKMEATSRTKDKSKI